MPIQVNFEESITNFVVSPWSNDTIVLEPVNV